ncbi:hypothetical protein R3P38DRAFT_2890918 [Favolaschia claudopus]|uniref:Proteophosphoglycan ppg4 n=1 Tax=Favolaschia claudopus TaxID=2862362 RepID=A0AAW0CV48_9AGAR
MSVFQSELDLTLASVSTSAFASASESASASVRRVPIYGNAIPALSSSPEASSQRILTSTSIGIVLGPFSPAGSAAPAIPTFSSSASLSTSTGFSRPNAHSVQGLSSDSESTHATVTFSGSTISRSPATDSSNAVSFSVRPGTGPGSSSIGSSVVPGFAPPNPSSSSSSTAPGDPTGSFAPTGSGSTVPAFVTPSTSSSSSRTFAHNTGAIVGVTLAAVAVTFVGVLLALCLCRRRRDSQTVQKSWISPPLIQRDDELPDAYSPVTRRQSRRRSGHADFVRPVSIQSLPDLGGAAYDGMHNDEHEHYDTDTWGAVPAAPTPPPPAASSSHSPPLPISDDPLAPEFYALPPSTAAPSSSTPNAAPVISAKGFMRRLRRSGRPSMASRGLLTTLAPVAEANTPVPSMSEFSRPPTQSSMGSGAAAALTATLPPSPVSSGGKPSPKPSPPLAAPATNPIPRPNYSLPWIHRTRSTSNTSAAPEMAEVHAGDGYANGNASWAI